jgi:hypothetical protein
VLDPGPGNTSEASYSESRITVTTQDSSPGVQHCCMANPMSEEPYALMWARTGLWEPWVVTPTATRPDAAGDFAQLKEVCWPRRHLCDLASSPIC